MLESFEPAFKNISISMKDRAKKMPTSHRLSLSDTVLMYRVGRFTKDFLFYFVELYVFKDFSLL